MRRRVGLLAGLALTGVLAGTAAAATPVAPRGTAAVTGAVDAVTVIGTAARQTAVFGGRGAVLAIDHTPGERGWTPPVQIAEVTDLPLGLEAVAGPSGTATVAWLAWPHTERGPQLFAVHRDPNGSWGTPVALGRDSFQGAADASRGLAPLPDGGAVAVHLDPDTSRIVARAATAAGGWDGGTNLSNTEITFPVIDAAGTRTGAVAVWAEPSRVVVAEMAAGRWTSPAEVPGVPANTSWLGVTRTSDGRTIIAWGSSLAGAPGGAAVGRIGGAWTSARFTFTPSAIAAFSDTVAVTGSTGAADGYQRRTAVLGAAGTWRTTVPPLTSGSTVVARDGSVIAASLDESQVWSWSRLAPGGRRWSTPVVLDDIRTRRAGGTGALVAATGNRGALATTVWSATTVPSRVGGGGYATLQYAELDPAAAAPFTVTDIGIRHPIGRIGRATSGAVVPIEPVFSRYAGVTPVRVQQLRHGRWVDAGRARAVAGSPVEVRVFAPGTSVRLLYGTGYRRATNALALRVTPPARQRVIAGWDPQAIAASGRALWVLSRPRGAGPPELRVLDARTGRLRHGPVVLHRTADGLVVAGSTVLLRSYGTRGSTYRVLDASRRGLVGPAATVTRGSCTVTACVPTGLVVAGRTSYPSEALPPETDPVAAPGGRVWGLVADATTAYDEFRFCLRLVETTPDGARVDRGPLGCFRDTGAGAYDMLAEGGGVWLLLADGLRWFGPTGPGVAMGSYATLARDGSCLWGLTRGGIARRGRVVALRPGAPAGPSVRTTVSDVEEGRFAVGSRTAWLAPGDGTLVKIPLPAC